MNHISASSAEAKNLIMDAMGRLVAEGVFPPEPLPADAPLLNMSRKAMDKLTLTPHVAGATDEAFTQMLVKGMANIQRMMDGGEPINVVNRK